MHRLLSPLGRFDAKNQEYRFFPVFWGKDYVVVFPLYWHLDKPFRGNEGTHALFPLWMYYKDPAQDKNARHTLHIAWPLTRFETGPCVRR